MSIVLDMTSADYFAHPAINKSLLDLVEKAPYLARLYLDGQYQRTRTPSMQLGTLFHTLVLEPHNFGARYDIVPKVDRRTKSGKEAFAEFEAESRGKEIITEDLFDQAQRMADSVFSHPACKLLLKDGLPEVSVFAELDGSQCKARLDWMRADGFIVDLKSTRDASPAAFARSAANLDYALQAAFYIDVASQAGVIVRDFVFVACESEPPYMCAAYTIEWSAIEKGREMYRRRLEKFQRCMESNEWPGISGGLVTTLQLPAWWGQSVGEFE